MTDDDLERLGAELHRRVDAQIKALRARETAKASGDVEANSQAEEAWQARLALAELAIGDEVRDRMMREIAPLDNQPDDPAANQRRGLIMQGRFLVDLRSLGIPNLADVAAGDTLRQLNGEEGQLSRPVATGQGPKRFDEIDRNLIRRYVLLAIVRRWQTGAKNMRQYLASRPVAPGFHQFRDWEHQFRRDRKKQPVPLEEQKNERSMAKEIGKALRAGRSLSSDQATLWDEIKDGDLEKMLGYVLELDPEKVLAAARRH